MAYGKGTGRPGVERLLAERGDGLVRTAVLLTGSREAGQDLLQAVLERLLRRWGRLSGDPEAHLRRTLANLAADGFRRRGRPQRKRAERALIAEHRVFAGAEVQSVARQDAAHERVLDRRPDGDGRAAAVTRHWADFINATLACGTVPPRRSAALLPPRTTSP